MRYLLLVVLFAVAWSCGGSDNSTPTTPSPQPACQVNNTAQVTFENRSNSNTTYTVLWDGSTLTTVSPGQKTSEYTVAAGVQHTLTFRVANSNQNACTPSTPTLAQCSTHNYWCTF